MKGHQYFGGAVSLDDFDSLRSRNARVDPRAGKRLPAPGEAFPLSAGAGGSTTNDLFFKFFFPRALLLTSSS